MTENPPEQLRELARSFGVQVEYVATSGAVKPASEKSLLAVLRALGVNLASPEDAGRALVDRRLARWRSRSEPVVIAWDGEAAATEIRFPAHQASARVAARLVLESGEVRDWSTPAEQLPVLGSAEIAGERFIARRLVLPAGLPTGYHRLTLTFDGEEAAEALVIAAPRKVFEPSPGGKRPWGVFCPLYGLRGEVSEGAGDFADLETLMDWTASLGGGLVATLPLLATSFDGPDPVISPYSPTTRLFWNEFYLDLHRIPELAQSPAARELLALAAWVDEAAALRSADVVAYGRQMRLKRQVLEILAAEFFAGENPRTPAFRRFLGDHPDAEAYAFFQAAGEKHGRDWRAWPASLDGPDRLKQVDPQTVHYHLFVQWQADEQLAALAAKGREHALTLYLDFPVGVDFNSFDVYREREVFATGASVGCPPDSVFTKGQNWGFPPLHPDRQREGGYRYLVASFRNHFRHASALRIDHVMGLHRLFWIPDGAEAKDGAFVSYPAHEIYAVLSVESHRARAWVVGEDLGTVPPEVAEALDRHAVHGMYVVQYEMTPDPERPVRPVPRTTVASINTHDMPPFAAFWQGSDLDDRRDLGLLDDAGLATERQTREAQRQALVAYLQAGGWLPERTIPDTAAVRQAGWELLAGSPANFVLLNLEDLWSETEPQNTPNTFDERPNWRRKLRRSIAEFTTDPTYRQALQQVDALRAGPPRPEPEPVASASIPIPSPG